MNQPIDPTNVPKAVNSKEAYEMITANPEKTFMIDVRTRPEYEFVGHPDLPGGVANIPLVFYNDRRQNENFTADVEARYPKEAAILIICRSGVRAETAAWQLLKAGYLKTYFVADSFEGSLDHEGHRTIDGWKNSGLPYTYYLDNDLIYKP